MRVGEKGLSTSAGHRRAHVRLVLDLLDGVHPRAGLGEVVHLFMQKGGGLDDMRRLLLEVVEKADLPGDQVEHTGSNEV